jgi:hypothetical protein
MCFINMAGKKYKDVSIPTLILLIAIMLIGFNLYYRHERFYLGESLIERQVVIDNSPRLIIQGKGGTDRYSFTADGYFCTFWLSHGSLDVIEDNSDIEIIVKLMRPGDTINIKIREADENSLQNPKGTIRVIEMLKNNYVIIPAAAVHNEDRRSHSITFGVAAILLVVWIMIQIKRLLKKSNESPSD